MSKQTLLHQYASKMETQGRNFMSDEAAQADALLWQNNRDEAALDRLFTDFALLAIKKTHDLKEINADIVSPEDIDAWALEGIQKAVEEYEVGVTKGKLITRAVNKARWNAQNELRKYLGTNPEWQFQGDKLLREATAEKGGPLTNAEEKEVLDTISPTFHEYYYARKRHNTITSGALKSPMWSEHPSTDDQAGLQWDFNDHMDGFIDGKTLSPTKAFERERLKNDVDAVLGGLTEREAKVLRMRFGVGAIDVLPSRESSDPNLNYMKFDDVCDSFGITRERIRQIEAEALRKLRHLSKSERLVSYISGMSEDENALQLSEDTDFATLESEILENFYGDLTSE